MEQLDSCEGGANGSRDQADTEHHDDRATRAANFAPSEITAPDAAASAPEATSGIMAEAESEVSAALKASHDFYDESFFSEKHLKPTFVQAYSLLHALIAGGDAALELARQQAPFDKRERKISRYKPELIALQHTAKPKDNHERDQCSSHACVLKAARKEEVTIDEFPAWLDDPNNGVKKCRERVAKKRSKDPELPQQPPRSKPADAPRDQLWLRFGVGKGREIGLENLAFVPLSIYAEVEELIKSLTFASKVSEVLRSLADLMASTEFVRALSVAPEAPIQPEGPELERARARMRDILRDPPEQDIPY